jgi:DNA-binding MarR family transcriptional regulator
LGTALLNKIGVPPPQELILLRLIECGTLPQADIVRYLDRDRSTTSATLQTMERAGLITRSPAPSDGRALDVSITDAGRALCPAVRDAWVQLEHAAFSHLSTEARAHLIDAMDGSSGALLAALEEHSHSSKARRQQ